jgi:hypothetical protein
MRFVSLQGDTLGDHFVVVQRMRIVERRRFVDGTRARFGGVSVAEGVRAAIS